MAKLPKDEYVTQLRSLINITKALRTLFSIYYIYEDGMIYGAPAEIYDWMVSVAKPTKPITMYQNLVVNAVDIYEKIKELKISFTQVTLKSNILTLSDTRNNVDPAVFYQINEDIEDFIDKSIDKSEVYRYLIDKNNLNASDYIKISEQGVKDIVNGLMYENDTEGYYFRLTKEAFPHIKKDTTISYRVTKMVPSMSPRYNKLYLTFKSQTPSLNVDVYSMFCIRVMN